VEGQSLYNGRGTGLVYPGRTKVSPAILYAEVTIKKGEEAFKPKEYGETQLSRPPGSKEPDLSPGAVPGIFCLRRLSSKWLQNGDRLSSKHLSNGPFFSNRISEPMLADARNLTPQDILPL